MILKQWLVALFLFAACSGITARQRVLLPAMQMAWPSIRAEVDGGIADGEAKQRLTTEQGDGLRAAAAQASNAIETGAGVAAVPWPALRVEAEAGVAARVAGGAVSPGVAASLLERQAQFWRSVATYVER